MSDPRLSYFQNEDILHLVIADGPEAASIEIRPNITAELDADGALIGIEILDATKFIKDSLLEKVQEQLLAMKPD